MRILLIDSDVQNSNIISGALRKASFVVDHTQSGDEGVQMLNHYDYDVVLTEIALSDMTGFDVIRQIRAVHRKATPLIVFANSNRTQAKIEALSLGADDYVHKCCDIGELVARLRAVIRRTRGMSENCIRLGNVEVDINSKSVRIDDKPIHLTGKEYAAFELLVIRRGIVITKDMFLNHLYGGIDEPEMKIIDVFICKLRRKLAHAGIMEASSIATVWGRGYIIRSSAESVSSEGNMDALTVRSKQEDVPSIAEQSGE